MTAYKGIVHGVPEVDYFANPALSSTEARLLLESPAKFRWKKDNPPLVEASKKFDVGSAVHTKVLGTGYDVEIIPPELLATNGAISTKAAKEFVAATREAGKIPLLQAQFDEVDLMAEGVLANPSARALFTQPGHREASVFATDPKTGVDVRARFDFLPDQTERRIVAVDLKTSIDASPAAFEKTIANYGYDTQRAWYLDALDIALGPMPIGMEPEFVFVVVEKEPPYLTAVYQLTTQWAQMGHTKAAHARELYAQCVETGEWPGYPTDINFVSPPQWALYQFEEQYR